SSSGPASLGSQVHAAAVNGDRSTLLKLITDPSLRDREDQFGRTPLMYCVLADRLDCAEILLKAGASVNKADHSQRTALHLAAQKGNARFLKLLLSRRANWLQKDLEEMTPLHLATRHPSPKALALLLKHIGPGEVDTQDKNKQTALHWSAFYNRPEHVRAAHSQEPSATQTVRCILEAAPTESLLNWQDYEGRTPLHFAVADGNQAVVEVLTSYEGCNVTAYDNLFRTPLHWAALLGHARIVHLLLERNTSGTIPSDSQGATPLHYGAQSNNAETVGVFLSHPSVKDEPDLEGRTAFMWAAGKGSDDVIRTMLALTPHIDINMADKYGGTALHAASLSDHVSTVKLLLDRGAMVDSLDVMKHTPLFRACEMGHRDVILTLIKGSARVDLVDVDGHTALHWAALGGNAEVCQILMENGISPNVQDQAGRTPLQCAAYGGYITCMAVLMENNADPNIQDKEVKIYAHIHKCTNISVSCYLNFRTQLLFLMCTGADPHRREVRYTPLDYALLGGHSEVTQFMLEHGALSIAAIQDIAAAYIQAVYKGFTVRKAFRERKQLLMRHEQLRKDAFGLMYGNLVNILFLFLYFYELANKSRSTQRSKTAEPHELPMVSTCQTNVTCDNVPVAPPSTRLKELLSPAGCSQPTSVKPRTPTMSKVREQPSLAPCTLSAGMSTATNQTIVTTKKSIPLTKRNTHMTVPAASGKTDAHTLSQKLRNQKEQTSERAATKDHTPSLRSCSFSDPKSTSRKIQSSTPSSISRHSQKLSTILCAYFTVSSLDCVPLTDTVNQAKQYSYHLRPHSAGQGTRGREKH
uniref:Inversin n=1 Tax=Mola mola TaxID=94237 RepID=A0A3Q3VPY0_MOLML